MKVTPHASILTCEWETDNQIIRLVDYTENRSYEMYGEYRAVVSGARDKMRHEQEQMFWGANELSQSSSMDGNFLLHTWRFRNKCQHLFHLPMSVSQEHRPCL